jgi:hypothetical protein
MLIREWRKHVSAFTHLQAITMMITVSLEGTVALKDTVYASAYRDGALTHNVTG